MTPTNAQFNGELNDVRLKMQIEVKIGENKEGRRTLERENL